MLIITQFCNVFREGELADMKLCTVFSALALCSFIAATLSYRAVDVQTISKVLSDVDNWEELAGWLDLASSPILAECQLKLNGARHVCYRNSLVRHYWQKCGSREKVVETIAQVLEEKMDNNLKAQMLRNLRFGKESVGQSSNREEIKSPLPKARLQDGGSFFNGLHIEWIGLPVAVLAIIATACYYAHCCRRRGGAGPKDIDVKTLDFRIFGNPDLKTLMNLVGTKVKAKWEAIGEGLGVKPSDLEAFQANHGHNPYAAQKCMHNVFNKWDSARTSEYSWQNLADVLASNAVDEIKVVEQLHKALSKTK